MSHTSAEEDPASPHPSRPAAEVTIRDVARSLNISHTTVSRALADSPKISEKTRQRVRQEAERLGYVPSASARNMRGRRSSLVGLVIPDVQNDFYASVAKVVTNALAARSMHLMLSITDDDPTRELLELRFLREMRPAGLIVVPSASPLPETEALLRSLCTVQLLRRHPRLPGDAVLIDDHRGIYSATRHLQDYGHKHIAYVGNGTELSTGRTRLAGFRQALAERGDEPAAVMLGSPRPEFARHAVTSIMAARQRPTGLILGSPELTLGALQALRSLGLDWPADVSVVGYHDPSWFELAAHGITTVRLPVDELGVTAACLVVSRSIAQHAGEHLPEGSPEMLFAPTLILRGSTAPLRS
ncbi:HTH lacI-type domain-containing protein [Cupriavidus oxalaticus]|uniref:LacI family DNA-binding transcriptional regulator n=1 Tax=Cupriavidus oxalaticus TaxID=96344 RepID=UPI003F73F155